MTRMLIVGVATWILCAGCYGGAMVGSGGVGVGVSAPIGQRAQPSRTEVRELVELINKRRRAVGCRPLIWDGRLATVAQRHSEDMARRHYFSHDNPQGQDPFDRLRAAGIRYRAAAENIADGARGADEVFEGWMESPGHRRNLENCRFTHHGIGLYENRWTHVLVRYSD